MRTRKTKKVPVKASKVELGPEVMRLLRHSLTLSQTTRKVLRGK